MPGAIFVVAETPNGQQGPVAALLSTCGWAAAARRILGQAWVVTPAGVVEPDVVEGTATAVGTPPIRSWRRAVPAVVKTLVKDVRVARRVGRLRIAPDGPWPGDGIAFVWQRHQLFHTAGIKLANALQAPSVVFLPAPIVWQAERWGVHRPGWGRWLEDRGERPALQAATIVACGTPEVAEQALRLGVAEDQIVITPTGVDRGAFRPPDEVPRAHDPTRLVVGWVGSFRAFHALEELVEAAAQLPGVELLLVGDGPERLRIERLVSERGVAARFTGTLAHAALPEVLRTMDAAVVVGPPDGYFHYSPLKLAEYLASGLPVVVPRAPQLESRLHDGVDALFVAPGDRAGFVEALRRLRDDVELRATLGRQAAVAASAWSWDASVQVLLDALERLRPGDRIR